MNESQLYELAIKTWGVTAQEGMFVEEIGEVLQALNKMHRTKSGDKVLNFIEEMADLEIMLNQMKCLYPSEYFNKIKKDKLTKLANKLSVGYNENNQ